MPDLTKAQLQGILDNRAHMERVRNLLNILIVDLLKRGELHDQSKIVSPEMEVFANAAKLDGMSFDSDEYAESRAKLDEALQHHYANNRHHPEHWPEKESKKADLIEAHIETLNPEADEELIAVLTEQVKSLRSSINNMNILDIGEMLCDWRASSERQKDGNLRKSIEVAGARFGLSDQLANIFCNSVDLFA